MRAKSVVLFWFATLLFLCSGSSAIAQSPIQEKVKLEKENASLKSRVETLEAENARLRTRLEAQPTPPPEVAAEPVTEAKTAPEKKRRGGFGKTRWGMTLKEVERHYPGLEKEGDLYIQKHRISNIEGALAFQFHEEKLVAVFWFSTEKYTNKNKHFSDFDTLANLLEQKYGEPRAESAKWDNDLYKGDSSNYGMAVSLGHLSLDRGWELEDTRILLSLSGQNFKTNLSLGYLDIEGFEKQQASEKREVLDGL